MLGRWSSVVVSIATGPELDPKSGKIEGATLGKVLVNARRHREERFLALQLEGSMREY